MPNGSKPQILVVDDEPSVRESLALLLAASGYDVAVAENGVAPFRTWTGLSPILLSPISTCRRCRVSN
jgi:CheY-like chemotaxis protein